MKNQTITKRSHTKTLRRLAYRSLERDSLNDVEGADQAFDKFLYHEMNRKDLFAWASRENEWMSLQD